MRGKKYPEQVKQQALALATINPCLTDVVRETGLPYSTVKTWKNQEELEGEFTRLRSEKKMEFAVDAFRQIRLAQELAERRLKRALTKETELDQLLEEIEQDKDMNGNTKASIISKLRALQVQSIKDLSTYIGTMYDKMALATGQSTSNVAVCFEQQLDDLLGESSSEAVKEPSQPQEQDRQEE